MKKINALAFMTIFALYSTTLFTGCDSTNDSNTTASDGVTPTITLKGNTNIEIPLGTMSLQEDGYSAFDFQDGDVTNNVQRSNNINWNAAGDYAVTYSVTDSDGNTGTAVRHVKIVNNSNNSGNGGNGSQGSAPVIAFSQYTVYLTLGENFSTSQYYNDYSATDAEDGDLKGQVIIDDSAVNSNITGTYVVSYSVTDSAGNQITQDKVVVIQNNYDNSYTTELDDFTAWYSDTCGRTFNESLYDESTRKYHGTIDCSYQGLSSIDLSALSIFDGIDDLDLSHNNLSDIDFSPIQDIHEMWGLHIDHNTQTLKKQYDTKSERVALFKYFTNIHGGSGNTDDNNAGLNIYFKPHKSMNIFFDEE